MPAFADALAELLTPGVSLNRYPVASVQATAGTLTLTINGGPVPGIPYTADLNPAAGQDVFVVGQQGFGMLAFARPAPVTASPAEPPPPAPVLVSPTALLNWSDDRRAWTDEAGLLRQTQYAGTLHQPDLSGAWFYDPAALAAVDTPLAAVELEVQRSSGDYLAVVPHTSADSSGPLALETVAPALSSPALGVAVWVPLPLSWGARLVAGELRGLALSSADYPATATGRGRLRFTSL